MKTKSALYFIESGPALLAVKAHIAERLALRQVHREMAQELGVEHVQVRDYDGKIIGVGFGKGKRHPDFRVPSSNGASVPKKNTDWYRRFQEQKGFEDPIEVIQKLFGVPAHIDYSKDNTRTSDILGNPWQSCGWLFLSKDGPYAVWVPDVAAEVSALKAAGYAVEEPAASFDMELPGCKRIEEEEWEILVLQEKLASKKRKQLKPCKSECSQGQCSHPGCYDARGSED